MGLFTVNVICHHRRWTSKLVALAMAMWVHQILKNPFVPRTNESDHIHLSVLTESG